MARRGGSWLGGAVEVGCRRLRFGCLRDFGLVLRRWRIYRLRRGAEERGSEALEGRVREWDLIRGWAGARLSFR